MICNIIKFLTGTDFTFSSFFILLLADRAYALYNNLYLPHHNCLLRLGIYPPGDAPEPESTAHILQVKQLSLTTDNIKLYNLFRPYGPIYWCRLALDGGAFKGVALVQYFKQEDADSAQEDLLIHTLSNRHTIALQGSRPEDHRRSPIHTTEGSCVPAAKHGASAQWAISLNVSAAPFQYNPQGNSNAGPPSPSPAEPTPTMDPCNLYIKNLDLNIKSSDLFNNFRKFGRIISARVMNNPITGQSKGFGFVSFSKPEEASKALAEMNQKLVMSKQIVVAYHEPKKPRDKPSSNAPSSDISVGERRPSADVRSLPPQSSPTTLYPPTPEFTSRPSDNMRRFSSPASSPFTLTQVQQHQVPVPNHQDGSFNTDYLANLSDVMRVEMIRNEVHKRVSNSGVVAHSEVEQIVNHLLGLAMNDTLTMLKHPHVMQDKIKEVKEAIHIKHSLPPQVLMANMYNQDRKQSIPYAQPPPPISISPAQISQRASVTPPVVSLPTTSLSQHNVSFAPHLGYSSPGRTLRRRGSVDSVSSVMTDVSSVNQRKKMYDAVIKIGETEYVDDIVDMLLTLKRKERSLCIFNHDFLKEKVKAAKEALDIFQDEVDFSAFVAATTNSTPTTPIPQNITPAPKPSSKATKTTVPPRSVTPPAVIPVSKVTTPIILPAKISKAIPIVAPPSSQSPTTPEPQAVAPIQSKVSEHYLEIEKFLTSIEDKSLSEKKQKLGDRLFPKVKDTGVKHAPKVTIRLLDTIDLRELAHLMYDPNRLKERVDLASSSLN
ncbi:hypothetical protein BC937DRAFT_92759 [Endogone sp. FLAS-F59071]|nr:hypothetical protein BC937DRAFT_92759 [Endogone sp. FLAS-F59071]|eukprot:RUS15201.1 hypothetical protein BC937DRAFT_92759 [Endogone sp. FLAS-F59071]